jgi:hypothetical protein
MTALCPTASKTSQNCHSEGIRQGFPRTSTASPKIATDSSNRPNACSANSKALRRKFIGPRSRALPGSPASRFLPPFPSPLQHSPHNQLHAFLSRPHLLSGVHVLHNLPSQGDRKSIKDAKRSRHIRQPRRKVRRQNRFPRLRIDQQRHFHSRPSINAQSPPDPAMYVKPVSAPAPGHQRALKRQPLNPPMHRNMQRIAIGNAADGLRDVTRNVDAPHDPDLLDLGSKDVRPLGGSHDASSIVRPPQLEKGLGRDTIRAWSPILRQESFSSGGRCFSADVSCVLSTGFSP